MGGSCVRLGTELTILFEFVSGGRLTYSAECVKLVG